MTPTNDDPAGLLALDSESLRETLTAWQQDEMQWPDERLTSLHALLASRDVSKRDREFAAGVLGTALTDDLDERLSDLAASSDPEVRELAMIAHGSRATESACDRLVDALSDPVNKVRNAAERSLLTMPDDARFSIAPRLRDLLLDEEPLTRSPAARLLGDMRDLTSYPRLVQMATSDPEWLGRVWATAALGPIGYEDAVGVLADILTGDEKNRVRMAAAESLSVLKPEGGADVLRSARKNEDDARVLKAIDEALIAIENVGE